MKDREKLIKIANSLANSSRSKKIANSIEEFAISADILEIYSFIEICKIILEKD